MHPRPAIRTLAAIVGAYFLSQYTKAEGAPVFGRRPWNTSYVLTISSAPRTCRSSQTASGSAMARFAPTPEREHQLPEYRRSSCPEPEPHSEGTDRAYVRATR